MRESSVFLLPTQNQDAALGYLGINGTEVDTTCGFTEDTLIDGTSRSRDEHDLPLPGAHVHRPIAQAGEE